MRRGFTRPIACLLVISLILCAVTTEQSTFAATARAPASQVSSDMSTQALALAARVFLHRNSAFNPSLPIMTNTISKIDVRQNNHQYHYLPVLAFTGAIATLLLLGYLETSLLFGPHGVAD